MVYEWFTTYVIYITQFQLFVSINSLFFIFQIILYGQSEIKKYAFTSIRFQRQYKAYFNYSLIELLRYSRKIKSDDYEREYRLNKILSWRYIILALNKNIP